MDVIKIPDDVQCLLSASARIHNYKSAVEELVYNSLDAESSCIAIRVHIQNNWIQIVDNGCGIKKADYKLLGERYATSKLTNANALKAAPSKYGYQGQALANIIEVSESVKMTSRSENKEETWVKKFTKGNKEPECYKVPLRPSKGTTVEINGFLFNLKIQKKSINAFNELQDIKTFLHQLSLVFNNVSISLRDDSENNIIFKMHKYKDHYQILQSVLDIDIKSIQELQVEKNEYKVKAYIGTEKKDIKNYQWIYLNNKFIQNSNLHTYINNKFSKPNHAELKKFKNKRANSEDSTYSISVPFYFLFITCPYYDYDIFNSPNKTIIEFKHWGSVNNILEKLVKLYEKEISFINRHTAMTKLQETSSKVEKTRIEVKKIMDRILGKPTNLSHVREIQNGIKGRHAKRRKIKQPLNNSIANLQIPANHKMSQESLESVENNNHTTSKVSEMNMKSKELNNKPVKRKQNATKGNLKVSKMAKKCKCNENVQKIVQILKNNTHSIKKSRNELSCAINNLLNFKDCKKYIKNIHLSTNQTKPKKNKDIETTIQKKIKDIETVCDKDEKNIINKKSSDIAQRPIDINTTVKVKSYDLLQTIINTQQDFKERNSVKRQTYLSSKTSKIQDKTITNCLYFSPGLTFQSHKYNIASKQQKYIQIKTGKITKCYRAYNAKSERKRNMAQSNETLKESQVSEDDIVQFSKQLRNQVMKDMKLIFDDKKCRKTQGHKLQKNCTDKLNVGINVNIESTYTILVDSIYNSLVADNTNGSLLDQAVSYTRNLRQDTIFSQASKKILPDEMMSELQYIHTLNDNDSIKPLDLCQVIINSSVEVVKENNEESTSSKFVTKNYIANDKDVTNNNILHQDDSPKSIHILEDEQKNVEKNDEIDLNNKDIFFYNFELNTRQRFLPKGMSQIFDNCFSKNICSYNLETEYYENIIYNNFVENVAINSEIFEPTVHNMKEFIKGDNNKQKINEKLTKHNADLTFGADSLRCAKILGQVDCKFIASIIQHTDSTPEFLVMFDQHAVHERIRLENNLSYYFNGEKWRKITIDTISLKLSEDEILYLHNHKNKFTLFGLEWTVSDNSEILVHSIPEAIKGKNPRPAETIVKNVKNLILEQIHAINNQKGNVSLYPQSIMNLVFSEACRYAIKFGDNLLFKDCVELIAALANCKTPFQCAHGRPVMAVIMELKTEHIDYKVNMKNIIQFNNRMKSYG